MNGAEALAVFPDGSLLLGGMGEDCIHLIKFKANGQQIWARQVCALNSKRDVIERPIQIEVDPANPGAFWLIFRKGTLTGSPENLLNLQKFDADGQILWEAQLQPEKRYGPISPGRECSASPSGVLWTAHAMGYTNVYPDLNQVLLFQTDPAGQELQRRFYYYPTESIANGIVTLSDGGALVYGSLGTAVSDGFLMKVNALGEVLWSKRYPKLIFLRDGGHFSNGDLLLTAQYSKGFAFARINTDGAPIWVRATGDSLSLFQSCIGADQGMVFSARRAGIPEFLFKVAVSADSVIWANAFETCTRYPIAALRASADGGYYFTQNTVSGIPATRLIKISADGLMPSGCPVNSNSVVKPAFQNLNIIPESITWIAKDSPLQGRKSLFSSDQAIIEAYDCCPDELPQAEISLPDSVCVRFPFQATATVDGCEEGWTWEIAGKTLEGPVLQDFMFEKEGVYPLKLRAFNGVCEDETQDSIRVVPAPEGRLFFQNDTLICPDKPLVISPLIAGYEHFLWSDSISGGLRVFDPPKAGEYILTAQRGLCAVSDTLNVELGNCGPDKFYAPNVFSPDGNGENDEWELFAGPGLEALECRVFDRWGSLCYYSGSGQTPRWDGRWRGQPVAPGVLVWTFRYRNVLGETSEAKGALLLIR